MMLHRFRPRARGRAGKIAKPFASIKIIVRERDEERA
jgi:large subunit ribosomal protein L22